MSSIAISLLDLEADSRVCLEADDYQKRPGKWCAGCGDFGALNAVKRLLAKEQLQPEKTVFVSGIGCSSRFPHYESHRPNNGYREYAGLARRLLLERQYRTEAERVTERLLAKKLPYYLFPLQLNSDSQIQVHSPFDGIRQAIDHVLASFAAHAPTGALLVIKNHPLDTGLIEYRQYAKKAAKTLGMADRLEFIDAGHLPTLLDHARGVVVVNSTVGLSALHHRRPLKALGTAIYDMEGMTWQGGLDTFWREAEGPDMDLYQAFLDYLVHHTQINGDFYTRTGIAMATAGAVTRLEAGTHA